MLNKKGLAMSELVIIIIAIVGFGVLAPAISYAQQKAAGKSDEIICHNSVAFRSLSTINVANQDIKVAPLLCKTIEKDVTGNREQIKEELAYRMARCWWMFNEARHDKVLDDSAKILKFLGWEDTENKCFLCYDLKIDEKNIAKASEQEKISAEEFFNYLSEKEHRQLKGWKYLDYFQYYGGPGEAAVLADIEPQKHYGVAFLARSVDNTEWNWVDTAAASALVVGAGACILSVGCGVAAVAGAVAGGGYLTAKGINEVHAEFYKEKRAISTIVFDDLKHIEASCQSDLEGD